MARTEGERGREGQDEVEGTQRPGHAESSSHIRSFMIMGFQQRSDITRVKFLMEMAWWTRMEARRQLEGYQISSDEVGLD